MVLSILGTTETLTWEELKELCKHLPQRDVVKCLVDKISELEARLAKCESAS